jgi:hypothetical protein
VLAKAGLLALSLALSLALIEVGLRLLTPFPIHEDSNKRAHPVLGYVLAGSLADVDSRGFRNASTRLEDAEVVVVGDSHTYGVNASADESFPARLAEITGARVYNMGVGSYGIYHYMVLLDELLAHASGPPETVVLALYLANDLANHCVIATSEGFGAFARDRGIEAPSCGPTERPGAREKTLRERSALLDGAASLFGPPSPLSPSGAASVFEVAPGVTVPEDRVRRHARATSLGDTRIAQSHKNAQRILRAAGARMRDAGVRFGVLLLPSRERVIASWQTSRGGDVDPELAALVVGQSELTAAYVAFLGREGIPVIDALGEVAAEFAAATAAGRDFYPPGDGHPEAMGYVAYARAAAQLVGLTHSWHHPAP